MEDDRQKAEMLIALCLDHCIRLKLFPCWYVIINYLSKKLYRKMRDNFFIDTFLSYFCDTLSKPLA